MILKERATEQIDTPGKRVLGHWIVDPHRLFASLPVLELLVLLFLELYALLESVTTVFKVKLSIIIVLLRASLAPILITFLL